MKDLTVTISNLKKINTTTDEVGYKGLTENGHDVYLWSNHPNTLSLSNVSVETVNQWWESMDNVAIIVTLKYEDALYKYNNNTSH